MFRKSAPQGLPPRTTHRRSTTLTTRAELYHPSPRRYAEEAAKVFKTPGGRVFADDNRIYEDLYAPVAGYEGRLETSAVRLGHKDPR